MVTLVQWLQLDTKGLNVLGAQLWGLGAGAPGGGAGAAAEETDIARRFRQLETAARLYDQKVSPDVAKGSESLFRWGWVGWV